MYNYRLANYSMFIICFIPSRASLNFLLKLIRRYQSRIERYLVVLYKTRSWCFSFLLSESLMSSLDLISINLRCFSTINHTDNHYCFDFKHKCLMLDTSVQF